MLLGWGLEERRREVLLDDEGRGLRVLVVLVEFASAALALLC